MGARTTPEAYAKAMPGMVWFSANFHRTISQSTVSESLSDNFKDVDTTPVNTRNGQWPELKRILWSFQQRVEERGGFTSGDILKEHAKQI